MADREGRACKSIEAAQRGRAGRLVELDGRGKLLRAALGFLAVKPTEPELVALHRCFDNWRGIGDIVTSMQRQAFEVSLGDHGAGQWIAVFYAGHGGQQRVEAAGTAQPATPWAAVQRAGLDALLKRDRQRHRRATGPRRTDHRDDRVA